MPRPAPPGSRDPIGGYDPEKGLGSLPALHRSALDLVAEPMKTLGPVLFWLLTALGYGIVIGWFIHHVWSAANFLPQPFPG